MIPRLTRRNLKITPRSSQSCVPSYAQCAALQMLQPMSIGKMETILSRGLRSEASIAVGLEVSRHETMTSGRRIRCSNRYACACQKISQLKELRRSMDRLSLHPYDRPRSLHCHYLKPLWQLSVPRHTNDVVHLSSTLLVRLALLGSLSRAATRLVTCRPQTKLQMCCASAAVTNNMAVKTVVMQAAKLESIS
jgi:hypothetical protein